MPRRYAPVLCTIWDDPDFRARTPLAQRMYIMLLSQKKLSMVGLISYTPRAWARGSTHTTIGDVEAAITELVEHDYVMVDLETDELLVRTMVKHDPPRGFKSRLAMWRSWEAIDSPTLRNAVIGQVDAETWSDDKAPPPPKALALRNAPSHAPPNGASETGHEQADAPCDGAAGARARSSVLRPPATEPPSTSAPSVETSSVELALVGRAPSGARKRDPIFDALIDACGYSYDEMTDRQRKACGVARAELARVNATPELIHQRAAIYRQKHPAAALTPNALASQWAALTVNGVATPRLSESSQALARAYQRRQGAP